MCQGQITAAFLQNQSFADKNSDDFDNVILLKMAAPWLTGDFRHDLNVRLDRPAKPKQPGRNAGQPDCPEVS